MVKLLLTCLVLSGCASGGWHWNAAEELRQSQIDLNEARMQALGRMPDSEKAQFIRDMNAYDNASFQRTSGFNPFTAFQQGYNAGNPQPASVNVKLRGY